METFIFFNAPEKEKINVFAVGLRCGCVLLLICTHSSMWHIVNMFFAITESFFNDWNKTLRKHYNITSCFDVVSSHPFFQ